MSDEIQVSAPLHRDRARPDGLTACDSKSDSSSKASTPGSASGNSAAGGGSGEGSGAEGRKPRKSGPRDLTTKRETKTTASGLKYTVLKQGTGKVNPKAADTVTVHYHGTLLNGNQVTV